MTRRVVTDNEIAQALLLAGDGETCAHEDRLWDLARGALDPDEAARVLDHTVDCPSCSLALRVAHETFAASGMPSEVRGRPRATSLGAGLWDWLAGGVLRPAPALVYLVLLLASYPLYRVLAPAPHPPPSLGLHKLQVLNITGDLALRGETVPPEPVHVRLGEGELLVLKLFPDIEDLPKDSGGAFRIRVMHGEQVVAEATRRVADLDADQSVSLLLDRDRLSAGTIYTVEVSEPPILRQSFRLVPD